MAAATEAFSVARWRNAFGADTMAPVDSYYGYINAVWYWRTVASRHDEPRHVSRTLEPGSYVYTEPQERAQRPNWLDPHMLSLCGDEVHLLTFHRARRASRGSINWHLWEKVPHDSLSPAGESSFVSSPELCFLQMAATLSFEELIVLGMELCGTYSLDPDEEEGFATRTVPLTSRASLLDFCTRCDAIHGKKAAMRALRFIADGAASPMETAIYLALCLPYKYGGYGIPSPVLNLEIGLSENAQKLYRAAHCRGDLCWIKDGKYKLVLEYLGVKAHEGSAKMIADRARTLAIEEMGYEVIEITKEQAHDIMAFDLVARRVAARIGKWLDLGKCGVTPARQKLFDILYGWELNNAAREGDEPLDVEDSEEGRVYGLRV